jgi:hypothetical protein
MSSLPQHSDVVIVGGGAAGLAAARCLTAAGAEVVLLEAAARLGGRIVMDSVDGFRLDRGFQAINTAYPALPDFVDINQLDLRFFDHAVLLADDHGRHLLADPRRHRDLPPLRQPPVPLAGLARLALLSVRLGYQDPKTLLTEPETTAASYLSRRIGDRTMRLLAEPFLTGVFGYAPLLTSSRVLAMIWRAFVRGRIGVPADGMQRLIDVLAEPLPPDRLCLNTPVTAIDGRHVHTADGTVHARAVLVAADPAAAARLVPGLPVPGQRILVTTYHATDEPPVDRPVLLLDGTGRSGIANSIVLTLAAPCYATSASRGETRPRAANVRCARTLLTRRLRPRPVPRGGRRLTVPRLQPQGRSGALRQTSPSVRDERDFSGRSRGASSRHLAVGAAGDQQTDQEHGSGNWSCERFRCPDGTSWM